MTIKTIAVLVVCSTFPALAAHAAEIACNPAGTQMEMNACAMQDFDKADKRLNQVYQDLLKQERPAVFFQKLKAAQKAWLAYRDAALEAEFACAEADVRVCFGSMYPLSYYLSKAKLTAERTAWLQQLLNGER